MLVNCTIQTINIQPAVTKLLKKAYSILRVNNMHLYIPFLSYEDIWSLCGRNDSLKELTSILESMNEKESKQLAIYILYKSTVTYNNSLSSKIKAIRSMIEWMRSIYANVDRVLEEFVYIYMHLCELNIRDSKYVSCEGDIRCAIQVPSELLKVINPSIGTPVYYIYNSVEDDLYEWGTADHTVQLPANNLYLYNSDKKYSPIVYVSSIQSTFMEWLWPVKHDEYNVFGNIANQIPESARASIILTILANFRINKTQFKQAVNLNTILSPHYDI